MKANFKPLGLATAVAAATAGIAGAAHATVANNGLGDLAIVPYYTVQDDWVTGVHITNTSAKTQVIKYRLRRASDSADVLDINLILSPYDVWTGYLDDSDGTLTLRTDDASCTAPVSASGAFPAPNINIAGAEEGYIEIISMGQPIDEADPIAVGALHAAGVPADCAGVATNFLISNVTSPAQTKQTGAVATAIKDGVNDYEASDNVLKVSFFIRDAASGIEFGNDAVHIADFTDGAWMTNQQQGLAANDLTGFDFPDLDGGPLGTTRGLYESIIRSDLGVLTVLNDWSYAAERGVSTDWVITIPGQYTMLHAGNLLDSSATTQGDYRDLPVRATFTVYDREEADAVPGGLVISPSPAPDTTDLPNEVNVITWGSTAEPVLGSVNVTNVDPAASGIAAPYGWANLAVTSTSTHIQAVCDLTNSAVYTADPAGTTSAAPAGCVATTSPVPMAGFVAWQRTFADPSKNYGRIVEHSFVTS